MRKGFGAIAGAVLAAAAWAGPARALDPRIQAEKEQAAARGAHVVSGVVAENKGATIVVNPYAGGQAVTVNVGGAPVFQGTGKITAKGLMKNVNVRVRAASAGTNITATSIEVLTPSEAQAERAKPPPAPTAQAPAPAPQPTAQPAPQPTWNQNPRPMPQPIPAPTAQVPPPQSQPQPQVAQPRPADMVGSSRVDLQACKLEYSIVSPK